MGRTTRGEAKKEACLDEKSGWGDTDLKLSLASSFSLLLEGVSEWTNPDWIT